jgi:hypothetical protein
MTTGASDLVLVDDDGSRRLSSSARSSMTTERLAQLGPLAGVGRSSDELIGTVRR